MASISAAAEVSGLKELPPPASIIVLNVLQWIQKKAKSRWNLKMKPGNLVKIKRTSVGVPINSIGLIIKKVHSDEYHGAPGSTGRYDIWDVLLHGLKVKSRRYLSQDLEVLS